MDLSKYSYFFRGFLPPEGFCIGVVAFVPSVSEVPSTFTELQDSLRNSWAPGVLLRLLAVPPSPANSGELENPDLSSIYLSSVLYLLRSETRISLHRVHPFTGAVINVLQKNTDYFPSPLQVSYVFLCISRQYGVSNVQPRFTNSANFNSRPQRVELSLPGWQELAGSRRGQKTPSILSSNAYQLICDKKTCFFCI